MPSSVFSAAYHSLIELLIEARNHTGVTQAELAAKLEKPQSFVSKYERGERRIDVVELCYICSALDISPHNIVDAVYKKINS